MDSMKNFEAHLFSPSLNKRTIYDFTDHIEDDGTYNAFCWRDGNFSCDCNRLMFLHKDHDMDAECSNGTNKVIVEKIVEKSNPDKILYTEVKNG